MQVNDYYPFGARHDQSSFVADDAKYGYQGKELTADLGLNLMDFHARQYDPLLGRFHSSDPMASSYAGLSPFAGMANNPISVIDPDGREPVTLTILAIAALKAAAIGAGIGTASYGVSTAISGQSWDWGQFGRSAAIGAASGVITAGVGSIFGAVGTGAGGITGLKGVGLELARAGAHGLGNVGVNAAFGNSVNGSSFATGAISSLVGSGFHGAGPAGQIFASAYSGGISAALTGGDFIQGVGTGAIIAGLNHAMHNVSKISAGNNNCPACPPGVSIEDLDWSAQLAIKAGGTPMFDDGGNFGGVRMPDGTFLQVDHSISNAENFADLAALGVASRAPVLRFKAIKNGFIWGSTRYQVHKHGLNYMKGQGSGKVSVWHMNINKTHIVFNPRHWGKLTPHWWSPIR